MNTRLKELRKSNNIKQKDMGKILGVSQRGYSHYENDRDIPTDILITLANFYNTSVDYLLYFTNDIEPYKRVIRNDINMAVRLKDLREDKDLFQKDIGKAINKPRSSYSYYENGGDVSTKDLINLAIYYNTSIDYILGITNEILPYNKVD